MSPALVILTVTGGEPLQLGDRIALPVPIPDTRWLPRLWAWLHRWQPPTVTVYREFRITRKVGECRPPATSAR